MKKELAVRLSDIPTEMLIEPVTDLVKTAIDSIRECVTQGEIQATQREAIRAQAAVAIAQIEADTSKYLIHARQVHEERMKIIGLVETCLERIGGEKDLEKVTELCVKLLQSVNVGQFDFQ